MDIQILAQKFYQYSTFIKGLSKDTIRRYKYAIDYYCKVSNITDLSQVTEKNIREFFIFGRTEKRWKVTTYLVFYHSLKVFFRWAIQEGYLQVNPIDSLEIPKLEQALPSKLTRQDSLRLLEVVYNYPYDSKFKHARDHAIFAIFLFAGLRRQELLNLKFIDVDVANLSIFVRQGKGNKDRIIPMCHTLALSLIGYIVERNKAKKTCPEFFTSSKQNIGCTIGTIKRLVTIMKDASDVRFSAHKLRHSFATLMLEGGCDIYSLSRMMGHSNIKTTTIYLHASPEHLRSQMTKHPLNNTVS